MKYLYLKLFNKIVNIYFSFINLFYHNDIKVLMLHEIVDDNVTPKSLQLSYSSFKLLVDKLTIKGNVISIGRFFECFINKKFYGEFVITFDDVYESVYQYGFPLLKAKNLPFTIFVNFGLLNTPGYITSDHLIEMESYELCTVGSHGMHHMYFRNLNDDDLMAELKNSKLELEHVISKPIDFFAFPYGSLVACSYSNVRVVKQSLLYKMSFSTIPSGVWNSPFISRYFIHRMDVTNRIIDKI